MDEIKAALLRIMEWTKIKCRLHAEEPQDVFFREREIWWAHLGENIGSEQNGRNEQFDRPALVVKKFSAHLLWILPMTTTDKEGAFYFPTAHGEGQKQAKAVLSQIRTISCKRLIKKQRTLSAEEFDAIRQRLREMI